MPKDSYAIMYMRPDGWWIAGEGWDDESEAVKAMNDHDWNGSEHKVIPVGSKEYEEAKEVEARDEE